MVLTTVLRTQASGHLGEVARFGSRVEVETIVTGHQGFVAVVARVVKGAVDVVGDGHHLVNWQPIAVSGGGERN